ncbi:methylated-DNA--[protein]-cysteine S-methyltransferase [Patulibacter defluvii]|uniref:methylated-DNA--[protein]-cysteine S-methyltransferase n=1 Tax=Patulibacter defluvii TaxID=3095358 RepID=UPI002A74B0E6|nr:MGMT family protein [Patulibacter sp. DM4]
MSGGTVLHHGRIATALGPLAVLVDARGGVHASGFTDDRAALLQRLGAAAATVTVVDVDGPAALASGSPTAVALAALAAYAAGDLGAIDTVRVVQDPDPARAVATVRRRLRAVPAGQTRTYAELAAEAGLPRAPRVAGLACSSNAAAPFVPCHRILRGDGSLGGYRWGLDVKRRLLAHEGAA